MTRSTRVLLGMSQQPLRGSLINNQIRLASTTAATATKKGASTKESKQDDSILLEHKGDFTTGVSRLREHYRNTVQDDLMVLTYSHTFKPKAKIPEGVRVELKGNRHIKPAPKAPSSRHIPELVKIDVHCMMKEALVSKYNLLSGFMAIQSITGEMPEIINSKKGVHPWKLRAGRSSGKGFLLFLCFLFFFNQFARLDLGFAGPCHYRLSIWFLACYLFVLILPLPLHISLHYLLLSLALFSVYFLFRSRQLLFAFMICALIMCVLLLHMRKMTNIHPPTLN